MISAVWICGVLIFINLQFILVRVFWFFCIWCIVLYRTIGLAVSVFANRPGDLGSIPGRVIPKTQKWYLMPPCLTLSIIRYGSRVKWSNPGKGVAPSPTHWCSKLSKREPSGHPRLWSLLYFTYCIGGFSWFLSIFWSISCISRSKNQPFFNIVLTWSGSLWLVVWHQAHSYQISIIHFLYSLCIGFLLK